MKIIPTPPHITIPTVSQLQDSSGGVTQPAPAYDGAYSWTALGVDLDKYLFFD